MNFSTYSLNSTFSHIYIEERARHLAATQEVLEKFPKAIRVPIRQYQEVFHRPQQDWQVQRNSRKLILACKPNGFLYPGVPVTPHFGQPHYYYNSPILNCVYDCEYCYLQGMYPSAHVVLFVNVEDFLAAAREKLAQTGSLYLCISYDTDLLALDHLFSWTSVFHAFAELNPQCTIELRTKSAQAKVLEGLKPLSNFIIAWTFSPQSVVDAFEHRTPPLTSRLKAAERVLAHGFPLRVCFDPVLDVRGADTAYVELVDQVLLSLEPSRVKDCSAGTFRMNRQYFQTLKTRRPESLLVHHQLQTYGNIVGYQESRRHQLMELIRNQLAKYLPSDKIWIQE